MRLMVTEAFRLAIWRYRSGGGRLWRLAVDHDTTPSLLSTTLSGLRRCTYDPKIVAIGVTLGLNPDEVFERGETIPAPEGVIARENEVAS